MAKSQDFSQASTSEGQETGAIAPAPLNNFF
jgi:hypothetical protein